MIMEPYYALELYQQKLDTINRWCEEKGLSEIDLKAAHKEYKCAIQYVRRNKKTISHNDARMIRRNEIIERNKIYSAHFRKKNALLKKLEDITKNFPLIMIISKLKIFIWLLMKDVFRT